MDQVPVSAGEWQALYQAGRADAAQPAWDGAERGSLAAQVEEMLGADCQPDAEFFVRCWTEGAAKAADDYLDRPLDFNDLLIENPAATFAVRIAGESMTGAGLFPGDIAVVDRSRVAVDRSIVLALLGGEFTIKRYRKKGARVWLQAENPNFKNIELTEDSAFEVWGVIAKSIRML